MAEETGIEYEDILSECDELTRLNLIRLDTSLNVVWVRNMFLYQGRGAKIIESAATHLTTLHNSVLVKEFLENYPEIFEYISENKVQNVAKFSPHARVRAVAGSRAVAGAVAVSGTESGTDTFAPRSEKTDSTPTILTFPCDGKLKEWHLTEAKIAEYQETYSSVDVLEQCKRALQWVRDNRKKTAKGMPRFLNSWLGRAVNSSKKNTGSTPSTRKKNPDTQIGYRFYPKPGETTRDFWDGERRRPEGEWEEWSTSSAGLTALMDVATRR